MHIAFVDRGGAHAIWRLMDYIAKDLIVEGHQVSYVQMDDGQQRAALESPKGVNRVSIKVPPKQSVTSFVAQRREFRMSFSKWIRSSKPDIVHTNFCVPGNWAREVAKKTIQAKVITTCHEMYGSMNPFLRLGVRRTEKYADAVVYISQAVGKSYFSGFDPNELGVDRHQPKHRFIYNGIDVDFIQQVVVGIEPREWEVASKRCRLVSVGRLVPEKGHSLAVRALPALLRQFPDLEYHIYGDGPERANLDSLASQIQVRDRLHLHGWVDFADAVKQMALASVVVMPSYSEGFGLAFAEALVTSAPVVASGIPVFKELVGMDSGAVRFFAKGNCVSLSEAVSVMVQNKKGENSSSGRFTSKDARRYSSVTMAKKYCALYEQLVGCRM